MDRRRRRAEHPGDRARLPEGRPIDEHSDNTRRRFRRRSLYRRVCLLHLTDEHDRAGKVGNSRRYERRRTGVGGHSRDRQPGACIQRSGRVDRRDGYAAGDLRTTGDSLQQNQDHPILEAAPTKRSTPRITTRKPDWAARSDSLLVNDLVNDLSTPPPPPSTPTPPPTTPPSFPTPKPPPPITSPPINNPLPPITYSPPIQTAPAPRPPTPVTPPPAAPPKAVPQKPKKKVQHKPKRQPVKRVTSSKGKATASSHAQSGRCSIDESLDSGSVHDSDS